MTNIRDVWTKDSECDRFESQEFTLEDPFRKGSWVTPRRGSMGEYG